MGHSSYLIKEGWAPRRTHPVVDARERRRGSCSTAHVADVADASRPVTVACNQTDRVMLMLLLGPGVLRMHHPDAVAPSSDESYAGAAVSVLVMHLLLLLLRLLRLLLRLLLLLLMMLLLLWAVVYPVLIAAPAAREASVARSSSDRRHLCHHRVVATSTSPEKIRRHRLDLRLRRNLDSKTVSNAPSILRLNRRTRFPRLCSRSVPGTRSRRVRRLVDHRRRRTSVDRGRILSMVG